MGIAISAARGYGSLDQSALLMVTEALNERT
jgi:hypothetical protein